MGFSSTQGDRGLWDEANCANQTVKDLQAKEETDTHIYDAQQAELLKQVEQALKQQHPIIGFVLGLGS